LCCANPTTGCLLHPRRRRVRPKVRLNAKQQAALLAWIDHISKLN
jgi:hypothetical protein